MKTTSRHKGLTLTAAFGQKSGKWRPDSMNVLLVEGEDPLRALLRRLVESEGHEVLEARNASEALSLLSGAGRSIDLVLLGVAGLQRLRKPIPRRAKLRLLPAAKEKT
jgi:DNA-binding NtrC family response regulator